MGQQQLLLLILGVIIVGIAIIVGIEMFGAQSTESNKDGLTSSLVNISADAYQYKIRPRTLGGGLPSYLNYSIPLKLQSDENGTYTLRNVTSTQIQLRAISALNASMIVDMTIDSLGKTAVTYSGW
jgi:hypothetical protein